MRTVRLVLWGIVGALLLAPVTAQAAKPRAPLAVHLRPLNPVATDTLGVSFTAGRLKPGERYQVGFANSDNVICTQGYTVQLPPQRPGRRVFAQLTPGSNYATGRVVWSGGTVGHQDSPVRFCAGGGQLLVTAVTPEGKFRILGTRKFKIAKDPNYPKPPGTPTKVSVLDGSILVKAAGRPDRTMPLGGLLRGVVPGLIQLNTDIAATGFTGGLVLGSLVPDPLCAGDRYTPDLSVVPDGTSRLVLLQSGVATLTLQLVADPVSLAGCATPANAQPTTVTLTGKVGDGGLTKLALSGTLTGVPIAAAVTADVTVNLLVNVDLSGQG